MLQIKKRPADYAMKVAQCKKAERVAPRAGGFSARINIFCGCVRFLGFSGLFFRRRLVFDLGGLVIMFISLTLREQKEA